MADKIECPECSFQNPSVAGRCYACGAPLEKPASRESLDADESGLLVEAGLGYSVVIGVPEDGEPIIRILAAELNMPRNRVTPRLKPGMVAVVAENLEKAVAEKIREAVRAADTACVLVPPAIPSPFLVRTVEPLSGGVAFLSLGGAREEVEATSRCVLVRGRICTYTEVDSHGDSIMPGLFSSQVVKHFDREKRWKRGPGATAVDICDFRLHDGRTLRFLADRIDYGFLGPRKAYVLRQNFELLLEEILLRLPACRLEDGFLNYAELLQIANHGVSGRNRPLLGVDTRAFRGVYTNERRFDIHSHGVYLLSREGFFSSA